MIGTVRCVSVSEGSAFTTIQNAAGVRETFILWFPGIPLSLTSFTRILHSMWLSLLREANSTGREVRIVHRDNGAEVFTVQLGPS